MHAWPACMARPRIDRSLLLGVRRERLELSPNEAAATLPGRSLAPIATDLCSQRR